MTEGYGEVTAEAGFPHISQSDRGNPTSVLLAD